MANLFGSLLKRFDLLLLMAVALLITIGVSTIQSTVLASKSTSVILTSQLLSVQLLSISAGVLLYILLTLINYRYFKFGAGILYVAILAALAGVLFTGGTIRGSVRWYDLGFFNLQPSVISIVLLTVCFADYFSRVGERINEFKFLFGAIVMVVLPALLIIIEPDLGSTIVLLGIWATQLLLSPVKLSRVLPLFLIMLCMLPVLWQHMEPYQKDRLTSFLHPSQDPLGTGYNINQSIIAVGSGALTGRGWGRGTQSHLQFLPEQHTDFVFATFAEEQGFLGAILVLWLYILILWRLFVMARQAEELFGQLIIAGIWIWLALHAFVNISMNVGMAPITGIPLPFISYGGTVMLTALIAVGLVSSVHFHQYPTTRHQSFG